MHELVRVRIYYYTVQRAKVQCTVGFLWSELEKNNSWTEEPKMVSLKKKSSQLVFLIEIILACLPFRY